ncbi:hypothetical protein KIN20_017397 [Parelaphostrongylus tenuis]|uniref:Rho-GAP domain-containing protein n=1 Tax=Parelaphostrongylus tenuis TaxID=148309 RepID=A0AAD5QRH3_PARTN|nr:hypothetical protein KIN20_017397 [Parelaphostrongylus tenuis]
MVNYAPDKVKNNGGGTYFTNQSPKKSLRQREMMECGSKIERGLVPDYKMYDTHVLASLLKNYLRSIPSNILLNSKYEVDERGSGRSGP